MKSLTAFLDFRTHSKPGQLLESVIATPGNLRRACQHLRHSASEDDYKIIICMLTKLYHL